MSSTHASWGTNALSEAPVNVDQMDQEGKALLATLSIENDG